MSAYRNIVLKRKDSGDHLTFHDGPVPYFSIPMFDQLGIKNGFSTRFGGVSTGYYAEMNLAALKESDDIIHENYRRILNTLHMNEKRVVLSYQTHTTNVRLVTEEDFGKGPFRPRDYVDTDGLVTDMPDVPLVTLYADCVPLYFYDPENRAIGLSHSGWRGTVNRMGLSTLKKMKECFGTEPSDVYAAVGPSICRDCYEVSEDVAGAFYNEFGEAADLLMDKKEGGKYQLDLWASNKLIMMEAGIPEDHIFTTDICTRCNSDLLYSHRVMGKERGTLGAFLSL